MIPFNKPYLTGNETKYIQAAVETGKISGDGVYTRRCHEFFESRFGFGKCLLTTSCTDALEMAALLINTQPGDEIIMPSYTFVSTANAFVLRGAKIVFADSTAANPNIDASSLESLITAKTKAIVVVHYAGIACEMDTIMQAADKHDLFVIEDAAQAIDSFYYERPLGSLGHLAAFSFHETKNVISGEGGMLVINDSRFQERAEIIREKGTNRSKFFRGEVDKYGWVDLGSSYLPSEVTAAFLFAQLECLDDIQKKRRELWDRYWSLLSPLAKSRGVQLPYLPEYATNNAHMFYLVCSSESERDSLIAHLRQEGIHAVFHYQSLHRSSYYAPKHDDRPLPHCDHYSASLVRLPLFFEMTIADVDRISNSVLDFYS